MLLDIWTGIQIAAMVLIGFGVRAMFYLKADVSDDYAQHSVINIATTFVICCGFLTLFMQFFQLYGICMEKSWIMKTYIFVMLMLLLLHLSFIAIVFLFDELIGPVAHEAMKEIWESRKDSFDAKIAYDDFQFEFSCCGFRSKTEYNGLDLPLSCCPIRTPTCVRDLAFTRSCETIMRENFAEQADILGYFSIVIATLDLAGLAFIATGITALLHFRASDSGVETTNSVNTLTIGCAVVIGLGSIIFIISFFGCCGAVKEDNCMTLTYAVFMVILFLLQLAVIAIIFLAGHVLKEGVEKPVTRLWERRAERNVPKTFNVFQAELKCCGLDGPADYANYNLPKSCCPESSLDCTQANSFQIGCKRSVEDNFTKYSKIIGYVAIGIAIFEGLAFIFACTLANEIRNKSRRAYY